MLTKKKVFHHFIKAVLLTAFLDYLFVTLINLIPALLTSIKETMTFELNYFYYLNPINTIPIVIHDPFFLKAQYLFIALTLFMFLRTLWIKRNHKTEDASKYGSHGSNRWATKKEIFDGVDIHNQLDKEGVILSAEETSKEPIILSGSENSRKNQNIFVIGGSGSGKSAGFAVDNIINIKEKSIVVTDPKGELYEKTAAMKRLQGYDVRMINFTNITHSDRYNPFDYIKKDTDAKRVAGTLIMNSGGVSKEMKGDFWDKAEVSLLSAFILYIKHHRPLDEHHFGSVFNLATLSYKDVHTLFRQLPKKSIAYRAYAQAIEKLDDKVRANVFISLLVSIDLWKYEDICKFTATSDFDLKDIGRRKTIVYVIIPIAEDEFKALISTFFTQLFSELYALADENFNKLPVRVSMILDEFNNIGKIPNFTERLSTTRSYGIEVWPIVQSIGQMRNRWGQDLTDEIIDNCDTILFLGTNSLTSKEYFSKMLGKTTIMIKGKSESKNKSGGSDSATFSMTGRSLLTPEEIGKLEDDQSIIIMRGKYPILAKKLFYFEYPELKKQLKEPTSRKDFPAEPRLDYIEFDPLPIITEINRIQIEEAMKAKREQKRTGEPDINDFMKQLDIEVGLIASEMAESGREARKHADTTNEDDPLANFKL